MCHVYSAAPPILSSPTVSLRVMIMKHIDSKCRRGWHCCYFTQRNQGAGESACPHFLPPASQSLFGAIYQPNPLPMFRLPWQVQSPCYHPDSLWGAKGTPVRKSSVLGEAIRCHKVVCFDLWETLGSAWGPIPLFAFIRGNGFNGEVQAERWAYWQNVGESGARMELIRGYIYFCSHPSGRGN